MSTTVYFSVEKFSRNKKIINRFWLKKAPYMELCSTFNINPCHAE